MTNTPDPKLGIAVLKQPSTFAGLSHRVEQEIEQAYWEFDAKNTRKDRSMSERDAFKWAVREMMLRLRK